MRVKVKNEFIDRHTGKLHQKDAVFSISEERYREIKAVGDFVKVIPDPEPETVPEPVPEKVDPEPIIPDPEPEVKPSRRRKAGK